MLSAYFFFVADASAGFERREDDFLRHVLLARQRVHEQQQFAVHDPFLQSIAGTSRARVDRSERERLARRRLSRRGHRSPSVPRKMPLIRFAPSTGALQRQLCFLAREARVIGEPLDRTVEAGRRYLEPLEIDVLDGEKPREVVRHARAILDVDAVRLVDEHADEPTPRRHVPVDELVPQRRYVRSSSSPAGRQSSLQH